ncbi:MAG: radical SAM protein [Deltaproteobacteria bacterium]|nr:radical SAM protein [Deltaproteobacteria bacterium]
MTWAAPSAADRERLAPDEVFAAGERNHHVSNTAYPIAHDLTWGPYRVPRVEQRTVAELAWRGIDDLCLYAHIPFCEVRCAFCEYTVVGQKELDRTEAYMDRLERELELWAPLVSGRLHGFDIGGGTPAFVAAPRIARLVEKAHRTFARAPGYGVSIETTPKIAAAEPAKMRAYLDAGIERISMGVQVIQPDLLRVLNRSGNGADLHRRAVDNIRAAGFRRFNVDLMYGFADQSIDSWRATLEHAVALGPEYVTLYRMRYKLTRISHQAERVRLDEVRAQATLAKELLTEAGYSASPGKNTYSRVPGDVGTSEYLTKRVIEGMPYLGLGLGAQSFTHTTISYADGAVGKNLLPYLRSVDAGRLPLQDLYDLPRTHMMAKFVAVSFYFGEIDRAAFAAKFGVTLDDAFPDELAFVRSRGLMVDDRRALGLTPEGARHFNGVIALFFAPSVQRYLLERPLVAAEEDLPDHLRLPLAVGGD